jgi:hypothetical protein
MDRHRRVEGDALGAHQIVGQLQALGAAPVDGFGYGGRGSRGQEQRDGEQDREKRKLRRDPLHGCYSGSPAGESNAR